MKIADTDFKTIMPTVFTEVNNKPENILRKGKLWPRRFEKDPNRISRNKKYNNHN